MPFTVSPTHYQIVAALRQFLLGVVPSGTDVIVSQTNRVPEPVADNFIVMTPLRRDRIETNIDTYSDVVFTASIAGTIMTVLAIQQGPILVGAQLFGTGLASGTTTIVSQLSGTTGGAGTYSVSKSQTSVLQQVASGGAAFLQPTQITIQLDVYGPDSANNAQMISTLMRDPYGVAQFALLNENVIPLYADDPRQSPFTNEQQQYQDRWMIEALLQANQTVRGVPQQFAGSLEVDLVEVDSTYPA